MASSSRDAREFAVGVIGVLIVVLAVSPAWVDALVAIAAALVWCWALERHSSEVVR